MRKNSIDQFYGIPWQFGVLACESSYAKFRTHHFARLFRIISHDCQAQACMTSPTAHASGMPQPQEAVPEPEAQIALLKLSLSSTLLQQMLCQIALMWHQKPQVPVHAPARYTLTCVCVLNTHTHISTPARCTLTHTHTKATFCQKVAASQLQSVHPPQPVRCCRACSHLDARR